MDDNNRALSEFDQLCLQAYNLWVAEGRPQNNGKVATKYGIPRHTFTNRLLKAFMRDLPGLLPIEVQPGHEVVSHTQTLDRNEEVVGQTIKTKLAAGEVFDIPDGHRVKGVSALVDARGNIVQQWFKTSEGERSAEVLQEAARIAADTYAQAPSIDFRPWDQDRLDPDLLNLHQLPDLHVGLHSDSATAQMHWDLAAADSCYRSLFKRVMERVPLAAHGVILFGGDTLHVDDNTRMTRKSGNVLDAGADYATILATAQNLGVYKVELALQRYETVLVRVLAGNHDPDSAVAVAHYLSAWFRNEPRVHVSTDPSLFWFYEFGKVMLAATHGHATKINELPGVMAADQPEMWGRTKFRFAHGFHIHHATRSNGEENGVSWETHNTPVPRDAYHQNKNYRSARLLKAPTYHRELGWRGDTSETLI